MFKKDLSQIVCWKCQKVALELQGKLGFREMCPFCGVDLHVCVNCRHYAPGKPNDCNVPGTEWVKDREAMNFCEEFEAKSPASLSIESQKKARDRFDSLFKEN